MIVNIAAATLLQATYLSLRGNGSSNYTGYLEYNGEPVQVATGSPVLKANNLLSICSKLKLGDYPLFTLSVQSTTSNTTYRVDGCSYPCYNIYLECHNFPFRLDEEGDVRLFFESKWASLCFIEPLTVDHASQFCKAFDLPSSNAQTIHGWFRENQDSYMIDEVCANKVTANCSSIRMLKKNICVRENLVAIKCNPLELRYDFVDWGKGGNRGSLELKIKSHWQPVSADQFTLNDAKVICRSLKFPSSDAKYLKRKLDAVGPVRNPANFQCRGSEAALKDCPGLQKEYLFRNSSYIAEIICEDAQEGKLRLTGGFDGLSGRLEVYHNNVWGTVCNKSFEQDEINTACTQITNGKIRTGVSIKPLLVLPTTSLTDILLGDVQCDAGSTRLDECRHMGWGSHSCSANNIVYLSCPGDPQFRLTHGTYGRLEVFHDNQWGTICGQEAVKIPPKLVCDSLKLNSMLANIGGRRSLPMSSGRIWVDKLSCDSRSERLTDCIKGQWGNVSSGCSHFRDLHVSCETPDKFNMAFNLDGRGHHVGLVNMQYTSSDTYVYITSGVCMRSPSQEIAEVACRTVDRSRSRHRATLLGVDVFPRRDHQTSMNDVHCTGQETHLLDCSYSTLKDFQPCESSNRLVVACGSDERPDYWLTLVTDSSWTRRREGRLDIMLHGVWGSVCDQGFTDKSAEVACRKLGLSTSAAIVIHTEGGQTKPVWLSHVSCNGWESGLEQCSSSQSTAPCWSNGKAVSIRCDAYSYTVPTKAIMGGILAGLLVVGLTVTLICFCVKRRRARRAPPSSQPGREHFILAEQIRRHGEDQDDLFHHPHLRSPPPEFENPAPEVSVDENSYLHDNPPPYDDNMKPPPGYDELFPEGPKSDLIQGASPQLGRDPAQGPPASARARAATAVPDRSSQGRDSPTGREYSPPRPQDGDYRERAARGNESACNRAPAALRHPSGGTGEPSVQRPHRDIREHSTQRRQHGDIPEPSSQRGQYGNFREPSSHRGIYEDIPQPSSQRGQYGNVRELPTNSGHHDNVHPASTEHPGPPSAQGRPQGQPAHGYESSDASDGSPRPRRNVGAGDGRRQRRQHDGEDVNRRDDSPVPRPVEPSRVRRRISRDVSWEGSTESSI